MNILHQTLRIPRTAAALATVTAVGLGCTPSPATPGTASQAAPSTADSSKPPAGPKIVGAVSSQGKEWKGGGVVYLEDAPKQPGVAMTATIDIHHKEFSPFISVITTGGTVTFGNKDTLTHHVFSPDVPNWDTGYLKKDETTAARKFDSSGAIALLCNIHPEMIGYLLVIPSTSFGVVGPDGKFVVPNAPPGTYKATLWAPRVPTMTQSVTVSSSGPVTVNFDLPPAAAVK